MGGLVMKAGSEAQFQQQIVQLAGFYGWGPMYHAPAGGKQGRVDREQIGSGFPDLVLVREHETARNEVLFWELKGAKTYITPAQHRWIDALVGAGLEAAIYRPCDFDVMHERLARGRVKTEPLYRAGASA